MPKPDLKVATRSDGLQVRNLGKSYKKKPVLRDVSMDLQKGEVVALLGPNGAGKTTCFYTIAGLVTPEAGSVHVDGMDVTLLPMYRRSKMGIGYLPQEYKRFHVVDYYTKGIMFYNVPAGKSNEDRRLG